MKKLLIITIVLFFAFTYMHAQDKAQFGVKGGVNLSTITGDDVESFDNRTCFHFGVVAEIGISETFSFQPELLYSCQGSDYSFESSDEFKSLVTFDGTVKLDYLNIPLMAKFYVSDGFSLEVGPQLGFLISAIDEYEGEEDDIKEYVKGFDFGANFGVGYKLEGGLNFGARYNLGLTDGNDDPDLTNATYKNSVIQFSLGYFF